MNSSQISKQTRILRGMSVRNGDMSNGEKQQNAKLLALLAEVKPISVIWHGK